MIYIVLYVYFLQSVLCCSCNAQNNVDCTQRNINNAIKITSTKIADHTERIVSIYSYRENNVNLAKIGKFRGIRVYPLHGSQLYSNIVS